MTKIYKIMVGKRQINDVYHNKEDARVNAKQTAIETGKPVTIWETEEYEAVPGDLFWTWVGIYGLLTEKAGSVDRKGPHIQTNSINGDEK